MNDNKPNISISKEAVADMPIERFEGKITIVDTSEKAVSALEIIEKERIVGFDTETRPNFKKGVNHNVALVQISTDKECFLFRTCKIGISARLKAFLENCGIQKIGLSLRDDFMKLHQICSFTPGGFVDLQDMVGEYGINDASLQKIYAIVYGMRISKGQRLTNWSAEELTEAQQSYASLDAWACLRLYTDLTSGKLTTEDFYYKSAPTLDITD